MARTRVPRRKVWLVLVVDDSHVEQVIDTILDNAGTGDIDIVYGEALNTAIDPLAGSGASRRFAVAVGGDERATFELVDRGTAERPAWLGVVRVAAGGRPREGERCIRFWRRPQVEEIVLSLLGAYERAGSRERAG